MKRCYTRKRFFSIKSQGVNSLNLEPGILATFMLPRFLYERNNALKFSKILLETGFMSPVVLKIWLSNFSRIS